jgi:hypothetical protein
MVPAHIATTPPAGNTPDDASPDGPCRMTARTRGFAHQSHSYRQPATPRPGQARPGQATTRIPARKCAPPPTSPQRRDRPTQVIGNQLKQIHEWQTCVQFRHRRPGTWARKHSALCGYEGICDLGPKVTLSDISGRPHPSALHRQAIGRQRRPPPVPSSVRAETARRSPIGSSLT